MGLLNFTSANIGQQREWQVDKVTGPAQPNGRFSGLIARATASRPPKEPSAHWSTKHGMSSCTDAQLVAECLKGSEQAWSDLIDKYKRLIYSIPIKYGAGRTDAADIFQSVCLELFSGLRNLRRTESLKAWIIAVTSHKCLHWKRQRRLETNLLAADVEGQDATAVPTELLEEADKEQCLREAIAQLPPRCREMIQMLFYEQPPLPYAEVARRLGLATGSIGFIRSRCLERLQKNLQQSGF